VSLFAALALAASVATAAPVDLTTWSQKGAPGAGNWTVQGGGSSVFQSVNGAPTFFVSPDDYLNTTVEGSFGVETTSDNDFIGFGFGYTAPMGTGNDVEMILFDWKQGAQSGAPEGFWLGKISGVHNGASGTGNELWPKTSDASITCTPLGTPIVNDGWLNNTVYDLKLVYDDDHIEIYMQGGQFTTETQIYDIDITDAAAAAAYPGGAFPNGKFAFYNHSQQSVRYRAFTQQAQAQGVVTPDPADLGDFHVGDPAVQQLTVSNVAAPGSDTLDAQFGPTTGDVTSATGSVTGLPGGASDSTSMVVTLDTATAGAKVGTADVDMQSVGATTIPLPTQTVDLSANVYRLAIGSLDTPQPMDFGIVHVGDVVLADLTVSNNAAADGFSENLDAAFAPGADPGVATNGGTLSGLAPGGTDVGSLQAGLDTSAAGVVNGIVEVAMTSNGDGVNTLGQTFLGFATVGVQGTVNEYANPVFEKTGGAGAWTPVSPVLYELDFGTIALSSGDRVAMLQLLNDVPVPADMLEGGWTHVLGGFGINGFAAVDLAPGDALTGLEVTLSSAAVGTFDGYVTLHPLGTNASGYSEPLPDVRIELSGKVVAGDPEPPPDLVPEPAGLLLLGLAGLIRRRRRD
jgi:MYXO-CTERM domain-containing protein